MRVHTDNVAGIWPAAATGPTVMKFGGSSVANAARLGRVVELIAAASEEKAGLVVVVSALGGVTDQLAACAAAAERGELAVALDALAAVRARHETVAAQLLPEPAGREYGAHIAAWLCEAEARCQAVVRRRRLLPAHAAAVMGLGERLAAPLLAAAVSAAGRPSQAIAATELIVLSRGGAPCRAPTAARCQERLNPLLQLGVVPVITGYICASPDGAPATLGRGGSDYSATILAAAMEASEIIIWTDVDGFHNADPRLVPSAQPYPDLSYQEAALMARYGAKVLHPQCLEPARAAAIPVWIRNTFAPQRAGTRITGQGVRRPPVGLAALSHLALLTFQDPAAGISPQLAQRAMRRLAALDGGTPIRFSPATGTLRAAVGEQLGAAAAAAWRQELDLAPDDARLRLEHPVAVLSAVGGEPAEGEARIRQAGVALRRAGIRLLAAGAAEDPGVTVFVLAQADLAAASAALHQTFTLPEAATWPADGLSAWTRRPAPADVAATEGAKEGWRRA
ncbi:MAG: aspartate kinase [Terriglobales bacterium]